MKGQMQQFVIPKTIANRRRKIQNNYYTDEPLSPSMSICFILTHFMITLPIRSASLSTHTWEMETAQSFPAAGKQPNH